MRVIISGGGTGGHIYPALSILNGLKNKFDNIEVVYVGNNNRMESTLIPSLGIRFYGIDMQGFNRKKIWLNFAMIYKLIRSYFKLKKFYNEFKPNIVIGTGGYVTVPVIYCAKKKKINTLVFDADANLGLATRTLAKYIDVLCVGYKSALSYPNCVFTGNPRGQELYEKVKRRVVENKILFVFGSLGSSTLNEKFLDMFNNYDFPYKITYVTGEKYYDEFVKNLKNKNIVALPYIENIENELETAKIVVTRSGAAIVNELNSLAIPAIYIPSPYVANNEQLFNAKAICELNGGRMIMESDVDKDLLIKNISSIYDKYSEIEESLINTRLINSRDTIINEIEKLW